MSEVENEIEVEVNDVVSPQENIQQMMDKMADGDVRVPKMHSMPLWAIKLIH